MVQKNKIEVLAEIWKQTEVKQGDIILIHSSVKKLIATIRDSHSLSITPADILESFILAVGKNGTLLFPTFNFDFPKTRYFDIRNTPSQMGALTNIALLDKRSIRTGHPIYSFAVIGANSNDFEGVNNKGGYDIESPFAILHRLKGKIGILGLDDQHSMTFYHYIEQMHGVNYRFNKQFQGEYIDLQGEKKTVEYELFVRKLEDGINTDVNRMSELLWELEAYKGVRHTEKHGFRTINCTDIYDHTSEVINSDRAIDYLYSINK